MNICKEILKSIDIDDIYVYRPILYEFSLFKKKMKRVYTFKVFWPFNYLPNRWDINGINSR